MRARAISKARSSRLSVGGRASHDQGKSIKRDLQRANEARNSTPGQEIKTSSVLRDADTYIVAAPMFVTGLAPWTGCEKLEVYS
jgi:hypothetical protein